MQNNKPKLAVFSLAPQRYGGLEVLFPIIHELKESGNCEAAQLFFFSGVPAQKHLHEDEFLLQMSRNLFTKIFSGSTFLFHVYLFNFLITQSYQKRKTLCFLPEGYSGFFITLLSKLKLVEFFSYPKVMTIQDKNALSHPEVSSIPALNFNNEPNQIGFPKFYKSWNSAIQNYLKPQQSRHGHAVVFLPSVVEDVFSFEELERWVNDVLSALDKHSSLVEVVLKPHPMLDSDKIQKLIQKYRNNLSISIETTSALINLNNAALALSHHSSVILDSLSANVPTIFYITFTEHWLKRHPEKSHFLNLGAVHIETESELESFLQDGGYLETQPRQVLYEKINHHDTLIKVFKEKGVI